MMSEIQELIRKGELDRAIEISLKKYEETKDERIYNLYGIALFKRGRFEESARVFGELYSRHPENEKLLLNYAHALMESGRLEEAERNLREGAMIFPESSKVFELLSECERRKKAEKTPRQEESREPEELEEIREIEVEESVGATEETRQAIPETTQETEESRTVEEEVLGEIPKTVKGERSEYEKMSLEQSPFLPDGFLKRARIVELNLVSDAEFVLRSTFVISVAGMYRIFPVRERRENRLTNNIFGGKRYAFVKLKGERASVMVGAEYISFIEISNMKFAILEHYLVGFEGGMQYNVLTAKVKGIGKLNVVELMGQGKVLIFSAGKKLMIRDFEDKIRVSMPNFVGIYGEGELDFLLDSVQIRGNGKVLLRI